MLDINWTSLGEETQKLNLRLFWWLKKKKKKNLLVLVEKSVVYLLFFIFNELVQVHRRIFKGELFF